MKALIIIACLLLMFVGLRLIMPRLGSSDAQGILQADETVLADCPNTPNCQCSESTREEQRVERFTVNNNPDQAIATLAELIRLHSGTQIIKQDERYLHASFATTVMAYTDDVEFLLSDDKKTVQVRSASRLGKSDLGANARRIEQLRAAALNRL